MPHGAIDPEQLSNHVGEALWLNGWLLDRGELYDRCLMRLRLSGGNADVPVQELGSLVRSVGQGMVVDVLLQSPSAEEAQGFARNLMALLGLAEDEAKEAQVRFYRLPLQDRQALLSLLWAPEGHSDSTSMKATCSAFVGLLDDETDTLTSGAYRALLALFDMNGLPAQEDCHD